MGYSTIWTATGPKLRASLPALKLALEKKVGPAGAQKFIKDFDAESEHRRLVVESLCRSTVKYKAFAETKDAKNINAVAAKIAELYNYIMFQVVVDVQSSPKRILCEAWITAESSSRGEHVELNRVTVE